jgi:photosystem II stability/assembly factor-like uncharacterized protein
MYHRKFILSVLLIATAPLLSGCTSLNTGSSSQAALADGGIYKSIDGGKLWRQRGAIAAVGKAKSLAGANIASWALDPVDDKTIYYSAAGAGLYYSLDEGESWNFVTALGNASIRSVAINPLDHCVLYASAGNLLYRSDDCARIWTRVYTDNDRTVTANAVTLDPDKPDRVYLGLSRGEIMVSDNRGESWRSLTQLKDQVTRLIVDPNDKETLYALTAKKGLWRAGTAAAWTDPFAAALKEAKLAGVIKEVILIPGSPNDIFLATDRGIAVSNDRGATWKLLPDILPDKNAVINALAVNPQNLKEIWFVTNTNLYRSIDGGATWTPAKLPTTRRGWALLVNPKKPGTIYMAVRAAEKK